MAEAEQHIDFVTVRAKDIVEDRQKGWAMFTRGTAWGIIAVILVLIMLEVFFG
jgi:hypothetical protein